MNLNPYAVSNFSPVDAFVSIPIRDLMNLNLPFG